MMHKYFILVPFVFCVSLLFIGSCAADTEPPPVPVIDESDESELDENDMIEIGGVVLDMKNQPIPKARIAFSYYSPMVREANKKRKVFYISGDVGRRDYTTDKQGQWTAKVAKDIESAYITIWPPGNEHRKTELKNPNIDKLKAKQHKTKLKDAYVLQGCVHDPEGQPLSGVFVYCEEEFTLPSFFVYKEYMKTDENGCFRFQSTEEGGVELGFFSKQFAPKVGSAQFSDEQTPLDIDLEPGKRVKIQVFDQEGNLRNRPNFSLYMKGAIFSFNSSLELDGFWPGIENLLTSSEPGTWEIIVPKSTPLELFCRIDSEAKEDEKYMRNTCTSRELLAHKEDSPFQIKMYKTLKISGKVRDADSGEAIKDYMLYCYEKIPASDFESKEEKISWTSEYSHTKEKDDEGVYHCTFSDTQKNYYLKVEAKGYRPAISKAFDASMGHTEYDFKLAKEDGSPPDEAVKVGEPDENTKRWDADRDLVDY